MSVGLLEQQSTGGATARGGFEYQDAFVLQNLPLWLSQGAFSHVVSEALGDVEVCYYATGGGTARVFYEAKNDVLTASDFWAELERFVEVHAASPLEYPRFVLVCKDYNSTTSPLVNKVLRLRGVGSSFPVGSPIIESDRATIVQWILDRGKSRELAEFVLDRVDFVTYTADSADHAFAGELAAHLPTIDLGTKHVQALRDRFKDLVRQSSSGPVTRKVLETVLETAPGAGDAWRVTATSVVTTDGGGTLHDLHLDISRFASADRGSRTAQEWQALVHDLGDIASFIKSTRQRKCVQVDGKQRMSMACALGLSFSATQDFVLQVQHNGKAYRTDEHDRSQGTFFVTHVLPGQGPATEGVVCIGFPTSVGKDAANAAETTLTNLPSLVLDSQKVIDGMPSLNAAVWEAKAALVRFRSEHQLTLLHVFVKAPSVFAMVLGHRLNGVGAVQLYDWVDGKYVSTLRHVPT